jgi:hypothetical protein
LHVKYEMNVHILYMQDPGEVTIFVRVCDNSSHISSAMFPIQFQLLFTFVVKYQFAAMLALMKSQLAGFDVVRWLPGCWGSTTNIILCSRKLSFRKSQQSLTFPPLWNHNHSVVLFLLSTRTLSTSEPLTCGRLFSTFNENSDFSLPRKSILVMGDLVNRTLAREEDI